MLSALPESKIKAKKTVKEYLQNPKLTQKYYHIFINSINSEVTKRNYHIVLAPFLSKHKFSIERTDEFLNLPIREVEEMIIYEIIDLQQNRRLSLSYVNLLTTALL